MGRHGINLNREEERMLQKLARRYGSVNSAVRAAIRLLYKLEVEKGVTTRNLTTEVNLDRLTNEIKTAVLEAVEAKLKEFLDRLTNEVNQLLEKVNHERLTSSASGSETGSASGMAPESGTEGVMPVLSRFALKTCQELTDLASKQRLRGKRFRLVSLYRDYVLLSKVFKAYIDNTGLIYPSVDARELHREIKTSVTRWVEDLKRNKKFHPWVEDLEPSFESDNVVLRPTFTADLDEARSKGEISDEEYREAVRSKVIDVLRRYLERIVAQIEGLAPEVATGEAAEGEESSLASTYSERSNSESANEEPSGEPVEFRTAKEVAKDLRRDVLDALFALENCVFDNAEGTFVCSAEDVRSYDNGHTIPFIEAVRRAAEQVGVEVNIEQEMDGTVTVWVSEPEKLMQLKRTLLTTPVPT